MEKEKDGGWKRMEEEDGEDKDGGEEEWRRLEEEKDGGGEEWRRMEEEEDGGGEGGWRRGRMMKSQS